MTANEFTTCLVDYFKQLALLSDGCGQNRNRILSSALSDLSQNKNIVIEQLYNLEKGHTMMEVDSVHSTIEQYIKPMYAPSD